MFFNFSFHPPDFRIYTTQRRLAGPDHQEDKSGNSSSEYQEAYEVSRLQYSNHILKGFSHLLTLGHQVFSVIPFEDSTELAKV